MLFLISSKVFILTLFNKKFGLLFLQLTNIEQLFVFGKYLPSELRKKTNFTLAEVILFFLIPDTVDNLVRLQKLNLHGNEITSISSNLSRCEMMTEFDVSNNKIAELPVEIFDTWKDLQTLKLKGNKLIFLPADLSKLTSLKYMDASKNNIASLPGQAFNDLKELTFLNLSTNGIVSVPSELGNCHELSYLNISDNGISSKLHKSCR